MAEIMNLLQETLDTLAEAGKTPADVRWVGTEDQVGDWETFALLADREYDNSYGRSAVHYDMRIVGDAWWLERADDDGHQWWEFKILPSWPEGEPLTTIFYPEREGKLGSVRG